MKMQKMMLPCFLFNSAKASDLHSEKFPNEDTRNCSSLAFTFSLYPLGTQGWTRLPFVEFETAKQMSFYHHQQRFFKKIPKMRKDSYFRIMIIYHLYVVSPKYCDHCHCTNTTSTFFINILRFGSIHWSASLTFYLASKLIGHLVVFIFF